MIRIKLKRSRKKRRETNGNFFVALLFFVLFPYIISGLSSVEKETLHWEEKPGQIWVLQKKFWGTGKVPLEEYLVGMLAATIPQEYEQEALKAQAVILRSYAMTFIEKKDGKKVIQDKYIKEFYFSKQDCQHLWKEKTQDILEKFQKAISETKDVVMVCEDSVIKPPFCRMSNGMTRDITEYVVHKERYPYLKSVNCEEDKMAEEYIQYVEITKKEFEKIIRKQLGYEEKSIQKITIYRDETDYVKEIKVGDITVDGEVFRQAFGVISSCYFVEKINDIIQIKTKGMGHGYGFSQYAANQQATNGKTYEELIYYFFENIRLEKI